MDAKEKGIQVKIHDANNPLPFDDETFDIVIGNQVLEHIQNTDGFLREIWRVLKEGGYCVISTPNLASLHNVALLLMGMQPISYRVSEIQVGNFLRGEKHLDDHIRVFTMSGLKDFFNYHGFQIESIKGAGFYPFPGILSRVFLSFSRGIAYT